MRQPGSGNKDENILGKRKTNNKCDLVQFFLFNGLDNS